MGSRISSRVRATSSWWESGWRRKPPGGSPRCDRTSPSSTAACPTGRASTCREIRSQDPTINALILTSYDDDDALFSAIMAGAWYVLKQIQGSDLIDTVRRVAAGQSMLDPAVTAQVLERLVVRPEDRPCAGSADLPGAEDPRADRPGHDEPADRRLPVPMEKTVKNYVSSLLAKLNLESRTQA